MDRRDFCKASVIGAAAGLFPITSFCQNTDTQSIDHLTDSQLRNEWLHEVLTPRVIGKPLILGKFPDGMYYVDQEIGWTRNQGDKFAISDVKVPRGFVTDLTSVPRLFWSFLPRDGKYTYAAIIHDYLYWTQSTSREVADDVLKLAMADSNVAPGTRNSIFLAVRAGGEISWTKNRELKESGEKRFLKKFPTDANMEWKTWRLQSDVLM